MTHRGASDGKLRAVYVLRPSTALSIFNVPALPLGEKHSRDWCAYSFSIALDFYLASPSQYTQSPGSTSRRNWTPMQRSSATTFPDLLKIPMRIAMTQVKDLLACPRTFLRSFTAFLQLYSCYSVHSASQAWTACSLLGIDLCTLAKSYGSACTRSFALESDSSKLYTLQECLADWNLFFTFVTYSTFMAQSLTSQQPLQCPRTTTLLVSLSFIRSIKDLEVNFVLRSTWVDLSCCFCS